MEKQKGANTSSGYNVSDKQSSSRNNITEPSLFTPRMATQNDLDRPFCGGGGGDEHVGSTTCNNGEANDVVTGNMYSCRDNNIYVHGENSTTNLQGFDIFASYPNTPYYKSPGGITFTGAQWKELERQAMIYKYMISAVPVPSDLLFPISRPFSADPSLYNVRYNKNGDPEPGRCKRTDGKKWRCSRDVAPHQKYCERHLHRGRPRSRKPVEITKNNNDNTNGGGGENKKKTRVEIPKSTTTTTTTTQQFVADASEPLLLFNAKSDLSISTNRDLSLMMEAEDRWHHFIEPNMGFSNHGPPIYTSNSPIFHQDYIQNHPLNIFPYPSYPPPSEIEAPIPFIDAWSIDNLNNTNNEPHKSSVSLDLSMAMAAGNVLDEEMENIQMGNDQSTNDSRWLGSWAPFARGGPLAEALQPGSGAVRCTSHGGPPSPHESISNTVTTSVSSPSGVIQRGLFSNSDGSVCNSPTVPSEVVFQWLN